MKTTSVELPHDHFHLKGGENVRKFFISKSFMISFFVTIFLFGMQTNKEGANFTVFVNLMITSFIVGVLVTAIARLFTRQKASTST